MMKSKVKSTILALGLVLAATGANAASGESQNHIGQHHGQPPSATEIFAKMDVNNDNKLAQSEVKGPLRKHFTQVDSNNDGFITQAELEANKPSGNMKRGGQQNDKPPSATAIFAKMDANKDNKLSQSEVKGPLSRHFTQVDINNDGYITQVELENSPKPERQRRS